MNDEVRAYVESYGDDIQKLFRELRELVYAGARGEPAERLWARLPSYYVGERFVRLLPFKDHINVEASALPQNAAAFEGYKLTPKGMLRLRPADSVPREALLAVFQQTLSPV